MARIEFVVFDIGETILREDRVWTEWADWLGVSPTVLAAVLGSVISSRQDYRLAFEMIKPGIDLAAERVAKEAAGLNSRRRSEDLYPDAAPCIEDLADLGYRVALAGNQPISIEAILGELALPLEFIASSERWGVAKPSPAFFARVVEEAGIPAERIAYVGDRLDNDVLPARQAGMFSVFIRRGPWGYLQAPWPEVDQADARIDSLGELANVLAARS
jgi:FMN hydrolase / 5-amino-6-(5-phospho-D-ribitylamino)uracil phosphatase